MLRSTCIVLCAVLLSTVLLPTPTEIAAQSIAPAAALERVGEYVERYYARAQSLVAEEQVSIQPLGRDMRMDGFARRLTYELRVEWDPDVSGDDTPAKVTRQLLAVNGRPPRKGQEPECLDPRSISPEPLAFLLPGRREKFAFTSAGLRAIDGQTAMIIDYKSIRPEPPQATWEDECASIELPGRARGRIWADPTTAEILRLDEGITGMVDVPVPWPQQRRGASLYMTIERADSTIRYRRVTFTDPDETLMLPATIETTTVIRNSGSPRTRITQSFGNYRRFVTGSRIVE